MALTISKVCGGIAPSVTLGLNAKVAEMKKQGMDVIGLGAGEPDFDTPEFIRDAAKKAMDEGKTRYTAASGLPELRKAIALYLSRNEGMEYEASQVIVCNGAKQALVNALTAILNPGDEVLLPEPCWVSYPEMIRMAGGVAVPVRAGKESGFIPTESQLRAAVTKRTKAILINSPSNPTGAVWTREQLSYAAKIAEENDFYIISDEIYDKLTYDGAVHVSVPTLSADALARTILVNGFSKTYAMTGWRVGYAAGPKNVISAMGAYQSHATGNPCSVAQYAALAAVRGDQSCVQTMANAFAARRDLILSLAEEIPEISCFKPQGAFYLLIDVSALVGKEVDGQIIRDSNDFAELLLKNALVAVVPCEAFGAENCCRLSYATSEKNIEEALRRIKQFVEKIISAQCA